MKLNEKWGWFLGFTAVFAALAAYVFWGTWSTDFAPVMPDSPIIYSPTWRMDWIRGWLTNGKFVPDDLKTFLGTPYFWQELKYAVPLYLSGLALAYFLRGRGLSRLASYGAGLLLAFCGYWSTLFSAGHLGWFQWMTYGVFAFGLADRAVRLGRIRHWLLLGACVAWGSFYQPDLWLLFAVFTAAYFAWCCVRERTFPWKGALLAGATFLVIGLPSIRSAFVNDLSGRDKQIEEGQTVSEKDRASGDVREQRWIFVTNWSLPPAESAEFFIPRINGDTSCPMTLSLGARYGTGVKPYTGALGRPKDAPAGNYRQHSLYVGLVTCLLALAGVVLTLLRTRGGVRFRTDIAFFVIAAILCWLFSMGRYCEPVYRVVFSLPFGDYLRAPVKWHHLTEFCLCVLAAYGVEALNGLNLLKGARGKALIAALVVIGAVDLARVDRLYCAPVDLREAKRQDCSLQMTFLPRRAFDSPQVAAMVRAKRIVSLAQPNPETYLVGVLEPRAKGGNRPMPPTGVATWLGVLSVLGSLAVGVVALKRA